MTDDIEVVRIWDRCGGGWDCAECGAEDLPDEETISERVECDNGRFGGRALCLACAERLGGSSS